MDQRDASSGDRLAIVTGSSRGIGAAVAARLLDEGWQVAGVARHPAAIDHPRYRHLVCDLANSAALAAAIERDLDAVVSDARWRRVGLVNNAAASGQLGPIETIDPIELLHVAAVNVVAPAWLMAFVLRRVRAGAALRIVNVSSGAAVRAFPGLSEYCGTKAALRMIGMVAAAELDSELRTTRAPDDTAILSYEPGVVDTEMQTAARTRPLSANPWGGLFRDFAASGVIVPPTEPAAEIVEFLAGDGHPRFTERRLVRAAS
jgi:benzil reductase ((S)-benzoin forming)